MPRFGVHVLVIEDEDSIAGPLAEGLRNHGFQVSCAATGADGLAQEGFDVVLLDLGLPDIDGVEVCRRLRAGSDVPVIVVSARSEEVDRVVLLEMGADDYVVKPFGLRELVARIRAVTRRTQAPAADELSSGGLRVDLRTHSVTVDGRPAELTPKEYDLLSFLAQDPGAVRTRQEILETVWDPHWYGPTKTLDVHVAALRRKLGDPSWIITVRGVGYRLANLGSSGENREGVPTEPDAVAHLQSSGPAPE